MPDALVVEGGVADCGIGMPVDNGRVVLGVDVGVDGNPPTAAAADTAAGVTCDREIARK